MIVFVHGCFWHGHGCKRAKLPATNTDYWLRKRTRNMERDAAHREQLEQAGWKVRYVWGCDIRSGIEAVIAELRGKAEHS